MASIIFHANEQNYSMSFNSTSLTPISISSAEGSGIAVAQPFTRRPMHLFFGDTEFSGRHKLARSRLNLSRLGTIICDTQAKSVREKIRTL
ncbi:MAG TPA: hypothetical protein VK327_04780 [Candidatus Paceibacterota bacterium]|nr:hypothetical protein [Candidatus Paceibacterota bacterium]